MIGLTSRFFLFASACFLLATVLVAAAAGFLAAPPSDALPRAGGCDSSTDE